VSQDTPSAERTNLILSLLVVAGIAGVAYADSLVVTISLAYLYLLPLALSALVHRLRTSLALSFLCVALHDWLAVGWGRLEGKVAAPVSHVS
jgi:hypothetical protein